MENKELLFGTKAVDPYKQQNQFQLLVGKIFTMQSIKFWLLAYLYAVGCFYLFGTSFTVLAIINTVLFPFSIILIGYVARLFMQAIPFIYRLLYPQYKPLFNFYNKLVAVLMIVIKVAIYVYVWQYSFVIGILGLVLVIIYANKLVK